MYILQENLFSFKVLQKLESKERLPIFFSVLDLRPYAKRLTKTSPRGADGHCRQGILRALLAAPLAKISIRSPACIIVLMWIFVFATSVDFD
jgi:hypothetical protein